MKADIVLVRHNSIMGKLIRKFDGGYYNHVGILVTDNIIIDAGFAGVRTLLVSELETGAKKKKLEYNIFEVKDLTQEQKNIIAEYVINRIGTKYDFLQLISLLVFFVFNINRKKEDPIDIRNKFICSELVSESFNEANFKFSDNIDNDNITPNDIACSGVLIKKEK